MLADLARFCSNSTNNWCLTTFPNAVLFTNTDIDFQAIQTDKTAKGCSGLNWNLQSGWSLPVPNREVPTSEGQTFKLTKLMLTSRAGSLEHPKHTHADITYLTNSWCINAGKDTVPEEITVFIWLSWVCFHKRRTRYSFSHYAEKPCSFKLLPRFGTGRC